MDFGITDIMVTLVGGSTLGILAKLVAPGNRTDIPLWLTVLCGMGGIALGTLAATATGLEGAPSGFDLGRHVAQLGVAVVLVAAAAGLTGRSSPRG